MRMFETVRSEFWGDFEPINALRACGYVLFIVICKYGEYFSKSAYNGISIYYIDSQQRGLAMWLTNLAVFENLSQIFR